MDYDELLEALNTIKKVCDRSGSCMQCPFGNSIGECRITGETPCEWDIVDNVPDVIRLFQY